jgi:hypothetical protein
MLMLSIGGSEHIVPTQARVMMFGFSRGPHVTITAGTGYKYVPGLIAALAILHLFGCPSSFSFCADVGFCVDAW